MSGGVAAFSPASIAGLKLWLDASQITGLNDGDAVATWSDLSGQSNSLTQGTASQKPTYKTNILNGKPVVRFDGVDDRLASAANFGTNNSLSGNLTTSVFVVYQKAVSNAGNVLGWGTVATSLGALGVYDDNSSALWAYAGSNNYPFTPFGAGSFIIREYHKAAGAINTTSTSRKNGTLDNTGAASANTPNVSGSNALILGRWADYTINLSGDVAEVLIYQGAAASVGADAIRAYLNSKYSIY